MIETEQITIAGQGVGRSPVRFVDLSYSYRVGEDRFSGRFALIIDSIESGEALVGDMVGNHVDVAVSPGRPQISFVVDRLVVGRTVRQDFRWA